MAFSILLVDDSLPMRLMIKKTFKAAGYRDSEFFQAANGIKALELLKHNWIDIVITDYTMPEMNGLELIRSMKQDELLREIPIVVIASDASPEKINRFLESGAVSYLKKPFAPEQLRDIITEILGETDHDSQDNDPDDDLDF